VEVGEIEREAEHAPVGGLRALRDKLVEVACHGKWSGRSVGKWLTRHKDRMLGGRSFRCKPGVDGQRWRLDAPLTLE
jgi:hypothetical protein